MKNQPIYNETSQIYITLLTKEEMDKDCVIIDVIGNKNE